AREFPGDDHRGGAWRRRAARTVAGAHPRRRQHRAAGARVNDPRLGVVRGVDMGGGGSAVPLKLAAHRGGSVADYSPLTTPRLNCLVVATSAAGYYLGAPGMPVLVPMAAAVAGTALVAGGAAVLNQVYERDTDALMRRTRLRPLPDGRVAVTDAR